MPLFDSNFLQRLEYLALVSRRVFQGQLLAQQRSKQLGGGIEFADHRQYVRGDDLRYVDWNVYARYGDLLLKRFQEEKDLQVHILLDTSRSMQTGNPSKFQYAQKLAAAIAYIALADLERITITPFSDRDHPRLPWTRGKDQILQVMNYLESLTPCDGVTNLDQAVDSVLKHSKQNGVVVIISDLFSPTGFQSPLNKLRYQKYEPHLIHIHSSEDAEPSLLGDIELEDPETGEIRRVTLRESNLQQYRQLFAEFIDSIDQYCRQYGISCTRATPAIPFDELLFRMMRISGGIG